MLLFQSLRVTTNCSAFCHFIHKPVKVICLLFVLVHLQARAKFHTCHWSDLSYLSLFFYENTCYFLLSGSLYKFSVFLPSWSLFLCSSLCKVLLLLSSFSLNTVSVLLKADLTDSLLSSAWRLISALSYSTVTICLLCYKCLAWSLFYQGNRLLLVALTPEVGHKDVRSAGLWATSTSLITSIVDCCLSNRPGNSSSYHSQGCVLVIWQNPQECPWCPEKRMLRLAIRINIPDRAHTPLP